MATEKNFWNILDKIMEGFQVIDYKWRYVYVNDAVAKHGHTTKEKLLGKTMMEAYPGIEKTKMFSVLSRCMKERVPAHMENEFTYPDGKKAWFELSIQPVPEGIFILSTDITERKRADEKLKQSEERHRTLFENTGTAMCIIEEDKTFSLVNREFEKLLGYSQEELRGKQWTEFVTKEHLDRMEKYHAARRKKGETAPKQYAFDFVTKKGQIRNAMLTIDMIPGTKKSVASILDITERKKAEEALREEKERFETYLNVARVIMLAIDAEGIVTYVNKRGCEVLGYKEEEIVGKDWFANFLPERIAKEIKQYAKKLLSGQRKPVEYNENPVVTKSGEERIIAWHNILLRDKKGKIIGTLSSGKDSTEQKKAEEALRKSEYYLRKAQQITHFGSWVLDVKTNRVEFSDEMFNIFGITKEQFNGTPEYTNNLVQPEDRARVQECYEDLLIRHKPVSMEYSIICPDGSVRHLWGNGEVEFDEKGNLQYLVGTVLDITERKLIEQQLKESEEKYRKQFEEALDAIFLADAETGIIVDCNRAATELVGRKKSELIGQHQRILHPPEKIKGKFTKTFRQHRKEKKGRVLEDQIITKNGEIRDVLINATSFDLEDKTLLQGTFRDITELKRAEQEMRELAYRLNGITPGECYISESEEKLMKVFAYSLVHGRSGLCITRNNPAALAEKYRIKPEHVRLLSSTPIKGFQVLSNLQEVSLEISKFLKDGGGIMLLDDLEYLISRFGFNPVYSMLQEKRYGFLDADSVLLIPVNFEALTNQEKALLASEFKTIK